MRRLLPALSLMALVFVPPAARAEVTAIKDARGGAAGSLVTFVIGDTLKGFWTPLPGARDTALLLNPEGDLYRDGPPSLAVNPVTGMPEAVWSYWDGAHYQIAWSHFDGTGWSMVRTAVGEDYLFLTLDDRQNLDPKIWIDAAGNRRVTWWRRRADGPDDIVVCTLPAGETQWWTPQRVSPEGTAARRPDIRTFPLYGTFIAAEEDRGGLLSAVVYDAPLLGGHTPQRGSDPWGRTVVQATGTTKSLGPAIAAQSGPAGEVPVFTWRVGSSLAESLFDAEALTWSAPTYRTYEGLW